MRRRSRDIREFCTVKTAMSIQLSTVTGPFIEQCSLQVAAQEGDTFTQKAADAPV